MPKTTDVNQARLQHEIAARSSVDTGAVVRELIATTKPGITRLVTTTAVVGFAMSGLGQVWTTNALLLAAAGCIIGTALAAGGANALNQWMERDRDGRMPRTANRPLPNNRLRSGTVLAWGSILSIAGCVLLWATVGLVPAAVAAACVVSYLAFYTPLKTMHPAATLAGAIPGALPPLIGWTAAIPNASWSSLLDPGGVSLVALMFVWQLPHFFAIAWMYREDYAAGGYRMLPIIDRSGVITALTILATAAVLLPLTVLPALAMPELLGFAYIAVAVISGVAYLAACGKLLSTRARGDAKRVFIASIIHLPLLLVLMVGEALVRTTLL